MPGFHVNDLKSNTGAFARAYLFNVYFDSAPVPIQGGENQVAYLVRSSSLPESTIDPIEVPWQGQTYKIGSTHTFSEWECTFNVDMAANVRRQMEAWMHQIHEPSSNLQGIPDAYFGSVRLELLSVAAVPVMQYVLHQAWPSSIGALELAQDSKDVAQFSVTFNYNWHTTL